MESTLSVYSAWINNLKEISSDNLPTLVYKLVDSLNEYKFHLDVELIFDSPDDFLYRQKGQLKIDNSVI